MFSKKYRARSSHITDTQHNGSTKHTSHFSVRLLKTKKDTRVGIVVSKKVSPSAVERNRLKRRIAHILKLIHLPPQTTVVVFAKKGAPALTTEDIQSELKILLP